MDTPHLGPCPECSKGFHHRCLDRTPGGLKYSLLYSPSPPDETCACRWCWPPSFTPWYAPPDNWPYPFEGDE